MSAVRRTARALMPPLLWQALRALRARVTRDPRALPEWEYAGETWDAADPGARGWEAPAVAERYRERWDAFVAAIQPPSPLSVGHEVLAGRPVDTEDPSAENALLGFAYSLAIAARGRERLSVLDWGGGLAHYAAVAASVLPGVELDYHCKETPAVCAAGREVNPAVAFHEDDRCLDRRYDFVLASGSLQYAPDWRELLGRLGAAAASHLYVARLPVVRGPRSFLVRQRAYAYGYDTEYVGWFVSRRELLDAAGGLDGLSLAREFAQLEYVEPARAPEGGAYRAFLLRRDR